MEINELFYAQLLGAQVCFGVGIDGVVERFKVIAQGFPLVREASAHEG